MASIVLLTGDIADAQLRCSFIGNRGCIHKGQTIVRRPPTKRWITCVTAFKGRNREIWVPGRWTVLFFYDEAVALAAGHRPCAECRRADFNRFADTWRAVHGGTGRAPAMDDVLQRDRLDGDRQRVTARSWDELPDGAFVSVREGPALVWGERLWPWSVDGGYRPEPIERPSAGEAAVLTPACTVEVLQAGYQPQVGLSDSPWGVTPRR